MFALQFRMGGVWHTLPPRYKSLDDAHQAAIQWRIDYQIPTVKSDSFLRVAPVAE